MNTDFSNIVDSHCDWAALVRYKLVLDSTSIFQYIVHQPTDIHIGTSYLDINIVLPNVAIIECIS